MIECSVQNMLMAAIVAATAFRKRVVALDETVEVQDYWT